MILIQLPQRPAWLAGFNSLRSGCGYDILCQESTHIDSIQAVDDYRPTTNVEGSGMR
jgi:hypothetical protein